MIYIKLYHSRFNRGMANIKNIQKIYPRLNNDDLLEFEIPASRFQVLLSEVYLHFVVSLDQSQISGGDLVPENWFGPKQFSSVEVKLNDDSLSRRSMPHEYALSTYLKNLVNYSYSNAINGCPEIGLFDDYTLRKELIKDLSDAGTWAKWVKHRKGLNEKYTYEIVMPIDSTIFNSEDLLPSGQKLTLSFERAETKYSTLITDPGATVTGIDKVLELDDVYLMIPYVEDDKLKRKESNWVNRPIKLKYDHYQMQRFTLPDGSASVRLSNVINGKLPKTLLFGIMKETWYQGSFTESSTLFNKHGLKELDLQIDGNSVPGMPVKMSNDCVSIPYSRLKSLSNNGTLNLAHFEQFHFIHCATIGQSEGSITFEMSFDSAVSTGLVLIVCSVHDTKLEIDQYGNFKIK